MGSSPSKRSSSDQATVPHETGKGETLSDLLACAPHSQEMVADEGGSFHVLIEYVTKEKKHRGKRPPVNLAIVLDRSGSMAGSKLNESKVAVRKTIDQLNNKDRVHLVHYDDQVETMFRGRKGKMTASDGTKLDAMGPGAATNLSGGLQQGFDETKPHRSMPSSRIFLFSDGQPNQGLQSAKELSELAQGFAGQGVNTTTFGIGSDYNEEVMRGIAQSGSGDYFFIDSGESIPELVQKGLDRTLRLVGVNARLFVKGMNGSKVKRVYGYTLNKDESVLIGDVAEGEVRQILVELTLPNVQEEVEGKDLEGPPREEGEMPPPTKKPTQQQASEVVLEWTLQIEGVGEDSDFVQTETVSVGRTSDTELLENTNEKVEIAVAMQAVADAQDEVAQLVQRGERNAAKECATSALAHLANFESTDTSGLVVDVLRRQQEVIDQLDNNVDAGIIAKDAGYLNYQSNLMCSGLM